MKKTKTDGFTTKNNILLVLVSIVCALFLWVYVTVSTGDTTTKSYSDIIVIYDGESAMRDARDLVITSKNATSVNFNITGSRRNLARLSKSDITAVVDLTNINSAGRYTLAYKVNFPSDVDSSSFNVEMKNPENVTINVDKLSTVPVEIKGVFNGSAAENYSVGVMEFNPNTVKISGPANIISQVADAWVEIDRSGLDKTLTVDCSYILRDKDGNELKDSAITVDNSTVSVTVPINYVKEVPLKLEYVDGAGVTASDVTETLSQQSVILSGDAEVLDSINSLTVKKVDLSTVESGFTETVPLIIPDGTKIVRGSDEVDYTLKFENIMKLEFRITADNLSVANVTEGYRAEIMADYLDVVLRGPENVLKDLKSESIKASADLAEYGNASGYFTVPVKVTVDGGNAGAWGKYDIYIRVSEDGD